MDGGQWTVDGGQWTVDNQQSAVYGLRSTVNGQRSTDYSPSPVVGFTAEVTALDGEVIRCKAGELGQKLAGWLYAKGAHSVLVPPGEGLPAGVRAALEEAGLRLMEAVLPAADPARQERLEALAAADAGVAVAAAGLASTGTAILSGERNQPQTGSLLPPISAVILREADIHRDLESFLGAGGGVFFSQKSILTLMSGPSRTADIEMTLTIGVHGPGTVGVFLV